VYRKTLQPFGKNFSGQLYVQAVARDSDNGQARTELTGIDPSYQGDDWYSQISTERKWLVRFNGVYHTADSYSPEVWMMLRAQEYSFYEVGLWLLASSRSLQQLWPEVMNLNFLESITELDVPAFFFVGRYDQNSPAQLTEQFFEQLQTPAGKQLVWFENSAHDLFFDEPQRVVVEVLSILAGQKSPH
jgi:pimeloyl-ACP methyl ester carboxylesterase